MAKRYRFAFKRLDAYQAAVQHFEWTCDVVRRMPKGPFRVVDQSIGASLSVMGNIGEANGREAKPGEIEQHYRYAQGSTFESATHLDAFSALGVISDEEYNTEESILARIAMMLTRLMQKQRRRKKELRNVARRDSREGTRSAAREPAPASVPAPPGAISNPREARPARREAVGRFESPTGVPERAQRATGIDSPAGVAEAAQPPKAIDHRTRKARNA